MNGKAHFHRHFFAGGKIYICANLPVKLSGTLPPRNTAGGNHLVTDLGYERGPHIRAVAAFIVNYRKAVIPGCPYRNNKRVPFPLLELLVRVERLICHGVYPANIIIIKLADIGYKLAI